MTKRSQKFAIQPRQPAVTTIGRRALNVRSTRRVKHPPRRRLLKTRTRRRQQTSVVRTKEHGVSHRTGGTLTVIDDKWIEKFNQKYWVIRIWILNEKVYFERQFKDFDSFLHKLSSKGIICIGKEKKEKKRCIWWYYPTDDYEVVFNEDTTIHKLTVPDIGNYENDKDISNSTYETDEITLQLKNTQGNRLKTFTVTINENNESYTIKDDKGQELAVSTKAEAEMRKFSATNLQRVQERVNDAIRKSNRFLEDDSDETLIEFVMRFKKVFHIKKVDKCLDFLKNDSSPCFMMHLHLDKLTRKYIPLPCMCVNEEVLGQIKEMITRVIQKNKGLKSESDELQSESSVSGLESDENELLKYLFPSTIPTEHQYIHDSIMVEYIRSRIIIFVNMLFYQSYISRVGGELEAVAEAALGEAVEELTALCPGLKQAIAIVKIGYNFVNNKLKTLEQDRQKASEEAFLDSSRGLTKTLFKLHKKVLVSDANTNRSLLFSDQQSLERYIKDVLASFYIGGSIGQEAIGNDTYADELPNYQEWGPEQWFNFLDFDLDGRIDILYLKHLLRDTSKTTRQPILDKLYELDYNSDRDYQVNIEEFEAVFNEEFKQALIEVAPTLQHLSHDFVVEDWKLFNGHASDGIGEEMCFALLVLRIVNPEAYGLIQTDNSLYILYMVIGPPLNQKKTTTGELDQNVKYTCADSILCVPQLVTFYPFSGIDMKRYYDIMRDDDDSHAGSIWKKKMGQKVSNFIHKEDKSADRIELLPTFMNGIALEQPSMSKKVATLTERVNQNGRILEILMERQCLLKDIVSKINTTLEATHINVKLDGDLQEFLKSQKKITLKEMVTNVMSKLRAEQ